MSGIQILLRLRLKLWGGANLGETTDTAISALNPFADSGLDELVLDDVLNNNATFFAEAGEVYTIMVGGFQDGW